MCYHYAVRGAMKMFTIIKKLFTKNKTKKVTTYLDNIDISLSQFQHIETRNKRIARFIKVLLRSQLYPDIISRYNVCVKKIEVHNATITELSNSYESLLNNYPIDNLLNNILIVNKELLEDIYSTILKVYKYTIPNSFKKKGLYDEYKKQIENILRDYEIIKEQKLLINSIFNEIDTLPDVYINTDNSADLLKDIYLKIDLYKTYTNQYYQCPIIDELTIEQHNERFIQKHLSDTIFDNIDGKCLDNEQRRTILCNAKSNLTIAGAGAGKTLTICGKVKYLLDNEMASKDEILLLSYSKKSATDLESRVNKIATGLTVETFHALGLRIITESLGKKCAIEDQLKSYITKYFDEELHKNPEIAYKVFQYIALYFYSEPTNNKKYKNDGEIFNDLKSCDFTTLKDRLKKLSSDEYRRETLKNEFVKSNEELVLANFFFINGINYEYERPYEIKTSTTDKRQYTPDFYLPDYGIYVEHYGINKQGKAPQYDKQTSDEYVKSMNWKRQIHIENQTKCIETYSYEFSDGTIFEKLKSALIAHGVKFNPVSESDILNKLHCIQFGKEFSSFYNLIMNFIALYKAQMMDDSGFDQMIEQLEASSYDAKRTALFLDICKDIYNYYIENIRAMDKIDFDDMILRSIEILDSTDNFKYKYIIVDEFQDISQSRTKFLQKLIEHGNAKLFAVGDDWQAIYRFAGCDINVFLDFDQLFEGAKLNFITSTHRNSVELQQIVEPFITANPNQYKKHIKSTIHQEKPVRIIYHNGNRCMALTNALKDISKINNNAQVLVLGRNRHDIDPYICKQIQVHDYSKIIHSNYPELKISYSTVHGSKGLESEFVILVSGENAQNGFPNKTEDDSILTLLLGKKDKFEYAEERRLFYVALTRTKSIVYLLSEKGKSSQFIQEIKNRSHIALDESSQGSESTYLCPWCKSGHLIVRTTENTKKQFYGCSNYPYCKYTNNDMLSVYHNDRCPICGDFLIVKKRPYGTFVGCHNYPHCDFKLKQRKD